MAFCRNCGTQLPEGAVACPNCGTFVNGQPRQPENNAQQVPPYNGAQQTAQNNGQQVPPYKSGQQVPPYNGQQVPPYNGAQQTAQNNSQQVPPYNGGYSTSQPAPMVSGDADVQSNKGMSVLAYFGIFLLIPLFARKNSDYCKFHVKQGFALAVTEIAYTIVTRIILLIIGAIFRPTYNIYFMPVPSGVYVAFSAIFGLAYIAFLVFSIMGIIYAVQGQKKKLPIFGDITFLNDLVEKIYTAINK